MTEELKIELVGPPAPEAPEPVAEAPKRRVRVGKKKTAPVAEAAPAEKPKRRRAKKEKTEPEAPVVYHRINSIPRGYALTHYTVAVLDAIGAFTAHRKAVDPKLLASFYNTPKVLSWHLGNGVLERTNAGLVRLTADGRSHFVGLTEGHPNYAKEVKPKIEALEEKIKNGGDGFSQIATKG